MVNKTINYGLVKPPDTEYYDIDVQNSNMDIIDAEIKKTNENASKLVEGLKAEIKDNELKPFETDVLKKFENVESSLADMTYQTAAGTATVITLTIGGTLINGKTMTFIASANNNGAETTINGKKLYKPNTTVSPNLIVGKAYTVWYNSSGDSGNGCFFIKASAEGNVTADKVLAGYTFSNDDDTGLVGTCNKKYGIGDSIYLPNLTPVNKFTLGTNYPAVFIYEDVSYYYVCAGTFLYKCSQDNSIISIINLNVGASVVQDYGTCLVEGNYIYVTFRDSYNYAKLAKIDYTTMTTIFNVNISAANTPIVKALYVDSSYIYFVHKSDQKGTWGKILKDGTGLTTSGLNTTVYVDGIVLCGKYIYCHHNNSDMDKIDITTNTLISTWTVSGVACFNFLYVPSIDTVCVVKHDGYLYKFNFGNNIPVCTVNLGITYGSNCTTLGYGFTSDGLYVYIFYNNPYGGSYYKIRLSDFSIIESAKPMPGNWCAITTDAVACGLNGFWHLSGSSYYYITKSSYSMLITS